MRSYFVAQAGLELAVFLPQPPKCWDYRSGPLYTAQVQFLNFPFLIRVYMLYACGHSPVRAEFGIRMSSYSLLYYTPFPPLETRSFTEPKLAFSLEWQAS